MRTKSLFAQGRYCQQLSPQVTTQLLGKMAANAYLVGWIDPRSDVVLRGRRKGLCTLSKVSKTCWFFVACPKTMAGVGHSKRIRKDAFRLAGATQETCSSEMLGGQGGDFLRGVAFWSMRSPGLLRWFCVTGLALRMTRITLSWQAQCIKQMEWKNRNARWYEAISFALNCPFLKEFSQNCFIFGVFNFENWGSLAELLHFWRFQVFKLNVEEMSQICCVFDVVKFRHWAGLVE